MKKPLVSQAVLAVACMASLSGIAQAQTPAPASTLSYNIGVVSEYRYRGLAQSRFDPAVQGGVDYADKSGFYVGAWASTIKWIEDNSTSTNPVKGNMELDVYGGYKFSLGSVAMDVGYLRYQYLNNTLANTGGGGSYKNANTDEAYVAGAVGPFTLKYSYAFSDLFGNINTKGSTYLDLNATFDLGNGFSLVPQVGRQTVKNTSVATYTHYSLSLNKDMGNGLVVTGTYHDTNANSSFYYVPAAGSDFNKATGKSAFVLGLKYTF